MGIVRHGRRLAVAGCGGPSAKPQIVWGRKGYQPGDLVRPRAIAIDAQDRLYIVDFTARIQVYDRDGKYLGPTWTTPDYRNGRPSGLSIDRDGHLIVSDSHYHCFRIYDADGKELRKFGGEVGPAPGQFGYVSDVVQDADGFYYVSEFGDNERITKLDVDGKLVKCWGEKARSRASSTTSGRWPSGRTACSTSPTPATIAFRCSPATASWFASGASRANGPGQLSYPYDLAFGPGGELYVVESAITACRSSRPRASRSAPGADRAGSRGNCTTRGRWPSTARAGSTSSIRKTTGCSAFAFDGSCARMGRLCGTASAWPGFPACCSRPGLVGLAVWFPPQVPRDRPGVELG